MEHKEESKQYLLVHSKKNYTYRRDTRRWNLYNYNNRKDRSLQDKSKSEDKSDSVEKIPISKPITTGDNIMKSYIITDEQEQRLAILGTYESILDYVIDPYNAVTSFKKCKLIGTGEIYILGESQDDEIRLYRFKSARQALQIMELEHGFIFSRIEHECLVSNENVSVDIRGLTASSVETTPSKDSLFWIDAQSKAFKNYRSAQGLSQKAFASLLNSKCNLHKDIKQTDISKVERGLYSFDVADWRQICNIIKH